MRVNPVSATSRSNVRRRRPATGEARAEAQPDFAGYLPPPPSTEPEHGRSQDALFTHYHPNSVFLAHLIATRDGELYPRPRRKTVPEICSEAYRATAALPRQRLAGHLIKTHR
ncbi:hypothetical protein [uncultured Roseibium sp.]|uniref:hypothetical protein n=1 Tax=uncultured Roseibium sp. TaxID=1936171 RepID=UPI002617E179|nr:hypothetical protein [uncultured Roseibium sp.]